ncbi:hypothetical protein LJR153_007313 [Paenibacillus sp. LjRoot153]|uniref:hypothetical protein n=1 Tax=Paenibacillus sp. LjRoot153 TaxID=3342270 RepID=UPI003ED167C7
MKNLHLVYPSDVILSLKKALENEGFFVSGMDYTLEQFKEAAAAEKVEPNSIIIIEGTAGIARKSDIYTNLREIRGFLPTTRLIVQLSLDMKKDIKLITPIVQLGIYDIHFTTEFGIEELKEWIHYEKTIAEYSQFIGSAISNDTTQIQQGSSSYVDNKTTLAKPGMFAKLLSRGKRGLDSKLASDQEKQAKNHGKNKESGTNEPFERVSEITTVDQELEIQPSQQTNPYGTAYNHMDESELHLTLPIKRTEPNAAINAYQQTLEQVNDDFNDAFTLKTAVETNTVSTTVPPSSSTHVEKTEAPASQELISSEINHKAKLAEQAKLDEQAKLAEQARLDEQSKLAEQAKLDEQAKLVEQARLDEQAKLVEQARLDEQSKLVEQARLDEQAKLAEQAKLDEQVKQTIPETASKSDGTKKRQDKNLLDLLDEDVKLPKQTIVFKERIVGTVKLGIAGAERRTGTTYQALQTSYYLSSLGFKVACVEKLDDNKNSTFATFRTNVPSQIRNGFRYEKVDFYPKSSLEDYIRIVGSQYDYVIADFGDIKDDSTQLEFMRCDVQIMTIGAAVWDFKDFYMVWNKFANWDFRKSWYVLVNFADDDMYKEMTGAFSKKDQAQLKMSFIKNPYVPNPLQLTTDKSAIERMVRSVIPNQNTKRKWFK